jgi:anti-sigma factor RsiW
MSSEQIQNNDWLAFQYIAGELPASDVMQFESCLADDLELQEAVARQVELTSAVASAFSSSEPGVNAPAVETAKATSRLPHWIGIAAALCVAIWAALFLGSRPNAPSDQQATDMPPVATDEFAAAWTQTMDNWPADVVDIEVAGDVESDLEDLASIATPDWMRVGMAGLTDEDMGDLLKEM